jgi:hypothetical protein
MTVVVALLFSTPGYGGEQIKKFFGPCSHFFSTLTKVRSWTLFYIIIRWANDFIRFKNTFNI